MLTFTELRVTSYASPTQVDLADAVLLATLSSLLIFYWVVRPTKVTEETLAGKTSELEHSGEDLRKAALGGNGRYRRFQAL